MLLFVLFLFVCVRRLDATAGTKSIAKKTTKQKTHTTTRQTKTTHKKTHNKQTYHKYDRQTQKQQQQ